MDQVSLGVWLVAEAQVGFAAQQVGGGIVGLQGYRLAVVVDRPLMVVALGIGEAALVVSGVELRVELQAAVEVGDGGSRLTLTAVGQTTLKPRIGLIVKLVEHNSSCSLVLLTIIADPFGPALSFVKGIVMTFVTLAN